jgi:hypothetical protein
MDLNRRNIEHSHLIGRNPTVYLLVLPWKGQRERLAMDRDQCFQLETTEQSAILPSFRAWACSIFPFLS